MVQVRDNGSLVQIIVSTNTLVFFDTGEISGKTRSTDSTPLIREKQEGTVQTLKCTKESK